MLKTRIIPTLLMRDISLVKGPGFNSWRAIGSPMQSVKVFNRRDVDELVLLDIEATPTGRGPDLSMVSTLTEECFVPMTIGGGIRDVSDIRDLLMAGADKVSINSAAYVNPNLIAEAADQFGSQCIVVAIDYRTEEDGSKWCYANGGRDKQNIGPESWALKVEKLGAGEIQLTSIERDGLMEGYDLETLGKICSSTSIPVIASGGAGNYRDMVQAVKKGAAAISASSIYLFTQATPLEAKDHLAEAGIPVRKALRHA